MSDLVLYAKQIEQGGIFLVLVVVIALLFWYILRLEERGNSRLASSIESLSAQLERQNTLNEQWQAFIKDSLAEQLAAQSAALLAVQRDLSYLSRDMSHITQTMFTQSHGSSQS